MVSQAVRKDTDMMNEQLLKNPQTDEIASSIETDISGTYEIGRAHV